MAERKRPRAEVDLARIGEIQNCRLAFLLCNHAAKPQIRGAAFGLRQSLDMVGAFLAPSLLAVGLMLLWTNYFRAAFWVAVIPGLMGVALLVFWFARAGTPANNPTQ